MYIRRLISSGKFNFSENIKKALGDVEKEFEWIYSTQHKAGVTGVINYTVWSDVFFCSECSEEIVFWDKAVDRKKQEVKSEFNCGNCGSIQSKKIAGKVFETSYDSISNETVTVQKLVPVLINYSIFGEHKRYEKVPDKNDLAILAKAKSISLNFFVANNKIIDGKEIGRLRSKGFTNVNQVFPSRANIIVGALNEKFKNNSQLKIALTSSLLNLSWLYRWRANGKGGTTSGTYYICSTPQENNALNQVRNKVNSLLKGIGVAKNIVTCSDCGNLNIKESSIDYIFLDPPFGANLMYSELSFLWESWLRVHTDNEKEAIENSKQSKGLNEYRNLMTKCFQEAYRILKPGRWLTIEFSNTKSAVWNSIQTALSESGFIIANVAALDKKQGSFKAVTTSTAVKQDLVISAYKPKESFEYRFKREDDTLALWDFIENHLYYLPVIKIQDNEVAFIPERDPRILFDRMISYFFRKGRDVPISSQEFQKILKNKFSERDGMYFLPAQIAQYDKKRALTNKVKQLSIFVDDEVSAIEWIRQGLKSKPKTYAEIHPLFINELSGWKKNELQLELLTLLEQNFIKFDGVEDVPSQIHAYLSTNFKDMRSLSKDSNSLKEKAKGRWYVPDPSKSGDIEKLRFRILLREFDNYKKEKKRIKQPRAEVLRAGFADCWGSQKYQTIIDVSAKTPSLVLQEDEKLLMFYDNALTLISDQKDDWD